MSSDSSRQPLSPATGDGQTIDFSYRTYYQSTLILIHILAISIYWLAKDKLMPRIVDLDRIEVTEERLT